MAGNLGFTKKRKSSDSMTKKKRKCSLKTLSFLDEKFQSQNELAHDEANQAPATSNKLIAIDDSQMDLIQAALDLEEEQGNFDVQYHKIIHNDKSSPDLISEMDEACFDELNDPVIKCPHDDAVIWQESDSFLENSEILNFRTPAKDDNAAKSNISFNEGNNLLNDSVFADIDLSLLEKNCQATSNSAQANTNAINNQTKPTVYLQSKDNAVTSNAKCAIKSPSIAKSIPVAASTPSSTKPTTGSFANRIRKRLMENAHKTPLAAAKSPLLIGRKVEPLEETVSNQSRLIPDDLSTQDVGPFYGLPSKVKHLMEKLRGIKKFYDWQHECLTQGALSKGDNLIYSLPTSGGKTLVAEILIMKTLLCKKRDAVLVLPFVAIVQEKIQSLSQFAVELGFLIEEYAGSKGRFPPRKRRKRNVLYVCTIEKANSLVNSLVENSRLSELGLAVVDELHMIGEGGRRGAAIETMLTKIMHISKSTQIIAMSATLGNTEELASFLQAHIYKSNFRPVELDEYVKVLNCLYKIDPTKLCPEDRFVKSRDMLYPTKDLAAKDTDHLASLVLEVIPQHSCLIFCPTKKNCENVALMISKLLPKTFLQHYQKEKNILLQALRSEGGALCPTLWKTIPFGIAYHHSGLTSDERRIIEDAYKSGILSVITCTSTLAAGVNLPARRVIIRSPHIGRSFMSRAQYKQMIGRAGRAGIDTKGESYLIVAKPEDQRRISDLVIGPMETCTSSLMYDSGKGFKALLLNLIGLKIISKSSEVITFFSQTLFSKQIKTIENLHPNLVKSSGEKNEITVDGIAHDSVTRLLDLKLIERIPDSNDVGDSSLNPTKLGIATFKSSIDLEFSNNIYNDLKQGLENLVLDSYLHLLYLVTPYDAASTVTPNWFIYMSEFGRLSATEISAANLIGVPEYYITRRASGSNPRKKKVDDGVVNRFYVTLMLYELFKGQSMWEVSARYEQPRGFLQNLLSSSASFASCVLYFSKELDEFWPYHSLLEKLIQVLQYCTVAELVPLMEIPGVKMARAKQLHKSGYKSLANLASADVDALIRDIEYLSRKQAQQLVASAKVLLTEKIESLQEEVADLKDIAK